MNLKQLLTRSDWFKELMISVSLFALGLFLTNSILSQNGKLFHDKSALKEPVVYSSIVSKPQNILLDSNSNLAGILAEINKSTANISEDLLLRCRLYSDEAGGEVAMLLQRLCFEKMFSADPHAALEKALKFVKGGCRRELQEVFDAAMTTSPDALKSWLTNRPSCIKLSIEFEAAIIAACKVEPELAVSALKNQRPAPSYQLLSSCYSRLAEANGWEALKFVEGLEGDDQQQAARLTVAAALAKKSPIDAINAYQNYLSPQENSIAMATAVRQLCLQNPEGAISILNSSDKKNMEIRVSILKQGLGDLIGKLSDQKIIEYAQLNNSTKDTGAVLAQAAMSATGVSTDLAKIYLNAAPEGRAKDAVINAISIKAGSARGVDAIPELQKLINQGGMGQEFAVWNSFLVGWESTDRLSLENAIQSKSLSLSLANQAAAVLRGSN
jgi:hypothetical protein